MTMVKKPVFLVGVDRSGTTLLSVMLNYHPKIAFKPDLQFVVFQMNDSTNWPDLSSYYESLSYDRIFFALQLQY